MPCEWLPWNCVEWPCLWDLWILTCSLLISKSVYLCLEFGGYFSHLIVQITNSGFHIDHPFFSSSMKMDFHGLLLLLLSSCVFKLSVFSPFVFLQEHSAFLLVLQMLGVGYVLVCSHWPKPLTGPQIQVLVHCKQQNSYKELTMPWSLSLWTSLFYRQVDSLNLFFFPTKSKMLLQIFT